MTMTAAGKLVNAVIPSFCYSDFLYNLAPIIGYMEFGYTAGYSSTSRDGLIKEGRLTTEQASWFASSVYLGTGLGNFIGALAAKKWGRKEPLLFNTLLLSLGWLLVVIDAHVAILFIGRILTGIGGGIHTIICPIYIGEISRPQNRGLLLASQRTATQFGTLVPFILGLWLSWRWLAIVGNILAVMLVLSCLVLPESPYWYVANGLVDEGRDSLLQLRMGNEEQANEELLALIVGYRDAQFQPQLTLRQMMVERKLRMPLLLLIMLLFFQTFSGSLIILTFLAQIFAEQKVKNPLIPSIIVSCARVFFALVASTMVDRAGRKKLLVGSGIVVVLIHTTIGLTYYLQMRYNIAELSWLAFASIIVFYGAIALGWGPIPSIILGEMLPYRVKGLPGGIVSSFGAILSFATTEMFSPLESAVGTYSTFWILAGINLIGIVLAAILLPETKRKTLKEIEQMFEK